MELITLSEAAKRAGLSLVTFRKRVAEAGLVIYVNPRDRRERLVDASAVDAMMRPRPMKDDRGKAAA